MIDPAHLGQWLRFLTVPDADRARRQRPSSMDALQAIMAYARAAMLAKLADIASSPIRVTDDGTIRSVRVLDSVEYGFNRTDRVFFAGLREEDGTWLDVPATYRSSVILDPCLPMRAWRRRIRYTLRGVAFAALMETLPASVGPLDDRHVAALNVLCHEVIDAAWRGLHMQPRLCELFPTKAIRGQIRKALAIDPALLALARAARFRTRHHAMTQQWLSFVWQFRGPLERIRAQTPALLQTVAQHMFQYGVDPFIDPTQACRDWLLSHGVTKGAYRLLAGHSARPLREVVSRFHAGESLQAVRLALSLASTGNGVRRPRPLFYRVTFDQFGPGAGIRTAQERLAKVPRPVFVAANARFGEVIRDEAAAGLALEYRAILDWWVESSPQRALARAGWDRWLDLARAADARRRAAAEASSWPCAVEEMRTRDAEVLALATPLALFEEGRALRHCVHGYVSKCRDDRVRLFSARLRHQGRTERATIALVPGSRGWRIWDIRGPCNRRMGGHWIPLARELAETYSRRDGSGQLPLPMPWKLEEVSLHGRR
jgi:hypothetical protein